MEIWRNWRSNYKAHAPCLASYENQKWVSSPISPKRQEMDKERPTYIKKGTPRFQNM